MLSWSFFPNFGQGFFPKLLDKALPYLGESGILEGPALSVAWQ